MYMHPWGMYISIHAGICVYVFVRATCIPSFSMRFILFALFSMFVLLTI